MEVSNQEIEKQPLIRGFIDGLAEIDWDPFVLFRIITNLHGKDALRTLPKTTTFLFSHLPFYQLSAHIFMPFCEIEGPEVGIVVMPITDTDPQET
jgi:hypothetical protein